MNERIDIGISALMEDTVKAVSGKVDMVEVMLASAELESAVEQMDEMVSTQSHLESILDAITESGFDDSVELMYGEVVTDVVGHAWDKDNAEASVEAFEVKLKEIAATVSEFIRKVVEKLRNLFDKMNIVRTNLLKVAGEEYIRVSNLNQNKVVWVKEDKEIKIPMFVLDRKSILAEFQAVYEAALNLLSAAAGISGYSLSEAGYTAVEAYAVRQTESNKMSDQVLDFKKTPVTKQTKTSMRALSAYKFEYRIAESLASKLRTIRISPDMEDNSGVKPGKAASLAAKVAAKQSSMMIKAIRYHVNVLKNVKSA